MTLVHLLFQLLQVIAHIPRFVIFDFLTLWNEAWGPLAQITNLTQETMWNPSFGFPWPVTETPSSETLVAEHTGEPWIYWGQWHNYLFVHNFMPGGNITFLEGLRILKRAWAAKPGKGSCEIQQTLVWAVGLVKPKETYEESDLQTPFPLKQEMTLFLVCGGVWVLCYLHLLAEITSFQSWLSKYEISRRSHEKSGIYICSTLSCCHNTFSFNSWAQLLL